MFCYGDVVLISSCIPDGVVAVQHGDWKGKRASDLAVDFQTRMLIKFKKISGKIREECTTAQFPVLSISRQCSNWVRPS